MFKKLAIAGAAAAAAFTVAPAQAAVIVINANPDPCTVSDPVCTFTFDQDVAEGFFSDTGTFTLPGSGTTSGAVITIAAAGNGDIEFTDVFLTIGMDRYDFTIVNGVASLATLINLPTIAGTYSITVEGNANSIAGYGGDLTFAAVPEPSTWALFILGFGALGHTMRRRSSKVRTVKASLNFA